jgi:alkaline phosphatase
MKCICSSLNMLMAVVLLCIPALAGQAVDSVKSQSRPAKFVFYFIGDGMASAQVHATEAYLASPMEDDTGNVKIGRLAMSRFPVLGMQMSYAKNRFITGSAAAGTALACGIKTNLNIISMDPDGRTPCTTIAELAKAKGMKVGIVTSVSLDHATPAVFYAHTPSRINYAEIGNQLLQSGFDYFAGGGFLAMNDAEARAAENGFVYTDTRSEFDALTPGNGKIIAVNPYLDRSKSIPYALNRMSADGAGEEYEGSITLAEFTEKGIQMMDNEAGFFMMVEGGKIDWACHANDARAAIEEVLAFDNAIDVAVKFAEKHPSDTLIVVTGDHECGGMTLGYAGTAYDVYYEILKAQTLAFDDFDRKIFAPYESGHNPAPTDIDADMWRIILNCFGLDGAGLTKGRRDDLVEYEIGLLENAFDRAMAGSRVRPIREDRLLYGTYNPLSVTLTHLLNRRSGLSWTSFSHTALPVPVFAFGVGSQNFSGYYENTEVARRIAEAMNVEWDLE